MSDDPVNDALMSSGRTKSASFEKEGDFVSGTILSRDYRQQTEYGSNEPLFWDDGKPRMQIVLRVQTPDQDNEEDDGVRGVYIKNPSQMWQATKDAVEAAGADGMHVGGIISIKYVGMRKSPKNPKFTQKVYEVGYRPPTSRDDDAPPF